VTVDSERWGAYIIKDWKNDGIEDGFSIHISFFFSFSHRSLFLHHGRRSCRLRRYRRGWRLTCCHTRR
jgi:hypothetical protein